ncbi:MAG: putative transporter, rane protein subunit and ATP-binding protein [Haloplasmataceae bacterium]|jgi:putative ABC transport system permease protein|nr:putative transporter, rane protein subunit and ATP-binding protein [Haloplasmataceae bacterium]
MIKLVDIHKIYQDGNSGFLALKNINLDFNENEFVCILGKSGSGKTTLLNILGGLDQASTGHMVIDGVLTTKFTEVQWDQFRNYKIGFIFQNYSLIEHLTVIDNVMLSNALQGVGKKVSREKALEMLKKVNIERHAEKLPKQLSGGERQRVSIARALVNDPDIILADEPTGSLDKKTAKEILEIIKEISKEKLVIMVTHSKKIANEYANRVIELKDGEVILDTNPQTIEKVKIVKASKKFTAYRLKDKINHAIHNIRMKKWRTFLTALGLAIGVSGFILIDGLSNGVKINVDKQINAFNQAPDLVFNVRYDTLDDLGINFKDYLNQLKSDSNFKDVLINKNLYLDVYKINEEEQNRDNFRMKDSINYLYMDDEPSKYFGKLVEGGKWPTNNNEIVISGNYARSLYEIDNLKTIWEKLNGATIEVASEYYYDFPYFLYEDEEYKEICSSYIYKDEVTIPEQYDEARFGKFSDQIKKQKEIFHSIALEYDYDDQRIIICENYDAFKVALTNEFKSTKIYTIVGIIESTQSNVSVITEGEYLNTQSTSWQGYDHNNKKNYLYYNYYIYLNENVDDIFSIKVKYREVAEVFERLDNNLSIPIFDILIELIQFIISVIMFISLITAGIMLLMVLLISVIERSREIGILRSLGATRNDILSIFLVESGVIGFIAGVLGVILAIVTSIIGNILIRHFYKEELISAFNDTNINLIMIRLVPSIVSIFVCIFFASAFGFLPAIRASKKTPIDALKRI